VSQDLTIGGPGGSITVTAGTLEQLVVGAAESVDGARVHRRVRRRLEVEIDGREARVELELRIRYGLVLPDVAREAQERVADALRAMCGVDRAVVDVSVEELEE
jgi:uncharacterized alkaline shock family protein YloU